MAKQVRVLKTWSVKMPEQMCPFTENIIKKMTGNTDFPNPPVVLADLGTATMRTLVAYGNRKNGILARKELQTAASEQNGMLLKIAGYVGNNAFGDEKKILATGFLITKTAVTKAIPPLAPVAPKLKCINGNLRLQIPKVPGAVSYCWVVYLGDAQDITVSNTQVNISTLQNTILVPGGTTRAMVTGIASGTKVTVQVFAQNAAGRSALSTAASTYVVC